MKWSSFRLSHGVSLDESPGLFVSGQCVLRYGTPASEPSWGDWLPLSGQRSHLRANDFMAISSFVAEVLLYVQSVEQ